MEKKEKKGRRRRRRIRIRSGRANRGTRIGQERGKILCQFDWETNVKQKAAEGMEIKCQLETAKA